MRVFILFPIILSLLVRCVLGKEGKKEEVWSQTIRKARSFLTLYWEKKEGRRRGKRLKKPVGSGKRWWSSLLYPPRAEKKEGGAESRTFLN